MENQEEKQQKIEELLKKVEESKKGKLDLSSDEDLSIAIMNLVSIEEHFFFTGAKTGKSDYYELLNKAREMRKELLKKIIKEYEGEVWCISKHLLAATMRLMEVGTKYLGQGQKKEAEDLFSKAYDLYSLFWALNLKLLNVSDIKKIDDNQLNVHDKKRTGFFGKLGELVQKVIDCCIE
jgi:tetratricopeptide (TPR) repeat protein